MKANSPRILIVEDDAILAAHLENVLRQMGYQVVGLAATGKGAIKQAASLQPDVILMDIRLREEMTGIEAAEKIRAKHDIPIIYLTAYTDEAFIQQAKLTDPYAYLTKPVRESELRASLEMVLYKHASERRLQHLNQVLRAIREINQLITREKNPRRLLEQACRILVKTRDYVLVWVGRKEEGGPYIRPVARAGRHQDYLEAVAITCNDSPTGQGPAGMAFCTNRPAVCNDIAGDPKLEPWREEALKRGFASVGAVPILHAGAIYGVLCVYAKRPGIFTSEEMELLEELTQDIGFALDSIQQEEARRQAEEDRLQIERIYRQAITGAGGVPYQRFFNTDRFAFLGDGFKQLTGYDPEEMTGTLFTQRLRYIESYGEYKDLLHAERVRLAREGVIKEWREDYLFARKDGGLVWIADHSVPIYDGHGKVIGALGILMDITERRHAVEALRESEERYRIVADYTYNWEYWIGLDGQWLYCSPSCERISGYPAEKFLADPLFLYEIIHPEDREMFARHQMLDGSEVNAFDFRIIHKSGEARWLSHVCQEIITAEGKRLGRRASNRDITSRKLAEKSLRESEERYRLLFELSPDAVVVYQDGKIVFVNQAAVKLARANTSDELVGKPMLDFVHPDYRPIVIERSRQMLTEGKPASPLEEVFLRLDGTPVEVEVTAAPFQLGDKAAAMVIIRDITERKRAEAELQASHEAERKFSERLTSLAEVTAELSKAKGLDELCKQAVILGKERLGFDRLSIWFITKDRKTMLGSFGVDHEGRITDEREARFPIEPASRIAPVVHGQMPSQRYDNVNLYTKGQVVGKGDRIIAAMWDGDTVIGFMSTDNLLKRQPLTQRDEEFLRLYATAVGHLCSMQHVQDALRASEKSMRRQLAELETIYESSLNISRLLEPREIAQKILDALSKRLAWHHAAIRLYHPETKQIEILALNHPGLSAAELQREIERINTIISQPGKGLSGWVLKHGRAILSKNVSADKRYIATFPGMRSGIYVPIQISGRAIGSISVESKEENAFNSSDLRLLETLATQAGIAFENARLYQEALRTAERRAILHRASREIAAASLSLEEVYSATYHAVTQLMTADSFTIALYPPGGEEIEGVYLIERGRRYPNIRIPAGAGFSGAVIKDRRSIRLDDYRKQTLIRAVPFGQKRETRSVLAVPMFAGKEVIGAISVQSYRPGVYTQEDETLLEMLAAYTSAAIENARLLAETQKRLNHLTALHRIDTAISASVDLSVTLDILLESTVSELKADAAAVLLFDPSSKTLEYAATYGFHTRRLAKVHLKAGEGPAWQAILRRKVQSIPDLRAISPPVANQQVDLFKGENFVSYYAMPLIAKGEVQGILEIFHRSHFNPDEDWFNLLNMLAGQAAIAIDNIRLFENLQRSNLDLILAYDATIQGWSQAMELRDKETEGHAQRVVNLTLRLAQAMGIPPSELAHIRRGTLLHDIGKMGIPDSILLKPAELTDEEWKIMKQHPAHAFEMLLGINYLRPALDIPRYHHERWDGSGYPEGLKGEQIPLAARIFAVVDVWDALTSDRPYRQAWSKQEAREYLKAQAGKQFDPKVVDTFLKIISEEDEE